MQKSKRADGHRLYEHIAESLAAAITDGLYKVGSRLPSERELAHTFSVSRPTIREAVIALEMDGLVDVRVGSGVYVRQTQRVVDPGTPDVGPFELLEARRIVAGEVCAVAARRIDSERLNELEALIREMDRENDLNILLSEKADRRFHETIAEASENTALVSMVKSLWDARLRSPLIQRMSSKAHAAGVKPAINEHTAILAALKAGNPDQARAAMHEHLTRVIETLLQATEIEEIERAKTQIAAQRQRYLPPSSTTPQRLAVKPRPASVIP